MSAASAPPPARPCPICGKPGNRKYRPFCSKRCADIDLGRWFGERYRIPAVSDEEEGGGDLDPGSGADKDSGETKP